MILGMLASRELSAYELAEHVGKGVEEIWPRASRQLYNAPKLLVKEGLITARRQTAGGTRTRTVYSITAAGRAALHAWLGTEPRPPALEFEGMLRVVLADQGSLDELRRTLLSIIAHAERERERFERQWRHIEDTDGGAFPERVHLFELSTAFMDGHFAHLAEWARWALTRIENWPENCGPPRPFSTHHHAQGTDTADDDHGVLDPPSGSASQP